MNEIIKVSRRYNIPIIEDVEGLGSTYFNKPLEIFNRVWNLFF